MTTLRNQARQLAIALDDAVAASGRQAPPVLALRRAIEEFVRDDHQLLDTEEPATLARGYKAPEPVEASLTSPAAESIPDAPPEKLADLVKPARKRAAPAKAKRK